MRLAPSTDADVYVVPPILLPPCLFPQRRTPFVVRPLASGDAQPSGPPSTSQPSNSTGVGSAGKTSGNKPLMRLPAPWQGRMAWGGGLGAGAFFGGHGAAKAQRVFTTATTGPNSKPAAKSEEGQKTVLIMYSNTGGGHRASAEALKQAFEEKHGSKYKIHIVDMWQDHTPAPFNQMPNTYSFMVKHSFLWQAAYSVTNPRWFHVPYLNTVGMFISGGIDKAYEQYNPDLVVSVHPLMQHVPVKVLRQRIKRGVSAPTNFATVVTDFTTCHNTWFCRGVSRCFVPTDYCRYLARDNGLEEGQIIMHGLPIRPVFSKKLPAQSALRAKFGMRKNTPAVLLVGGGEGMGKLEETVDQLEARLGASCQVVVICGRNQALLERLRAKARAYPSGMAVLPLGFVDNIHEWMAACDVIITKAGPGTIAEALISGLPILLNGNVPCQEEGNIPYVIDNEVGTFETRPSKISEIVAEWFGPLKAELTHMKHRARELGRPEAVYKIVQDLVKLAETPCMTFGPASVLANGGKGQLRVA